MGELIDKAKGKAKRVQGQVTGDRSKEAEGVAQEYKGKVEGVLDDINEVGPVSRVTGVGRRDGPAQGGLNGFPREEKPDRLHAFQLIPIEELVGVNRVIGPLDRAIVPVKAGKVHGYVVQAIALAAKEVIGRVGHRVSV